MNTLEDPPTAPVTSAAAARQGALSPRATAFPTRQSFWTRHKILINFWLDVVLAGLFLVLAWMLIVIRYVFPRGVRVWTIWGGAVEDWQDALFGVFCIFSLGIVLHVMLHWDWICATVATRLLGRKAERDDGTQTLIGVGVLVVAIHLIIASVLAAKVSLLSGTPM